MKLYLNIFLLMLTAGCTTMPEAPQARLASHCPTSYDTGPCISTIITNMPEVISYSRGGEVNPQIEDVQIWREGPVDPNTGKPRQNWEPIADITLGVLERPNVASKPKSFEIIVPHAMCTPAIASVAFLGETADGAITLLSSTGPIDVAEPHLDIGLDVRLIIDPNTKTILSKLIGPIDFQQRYAFAFGEEDQVAMAYQGQCYKALRRGRPLTLSLVNDEACGSLLKRMQEASITSQLNSVGDEGLIEASESDLALTRQILEDANFWLPGLAARSSRTANRKYIVVNIHVACT